MTRKTDSIFMAKRVIKVTGTLHESHSEPKSLITATLIDLLEYYPNEKHTRINGEKT